MIEADIQRKTQSEDVFTSCCIGLLELLPDDLYLISFLRKAIHIRGDLLKISEGCSIQDISYWPGFPSGYPDVVIGLTDGTVLIIEIKHGSPMSGDGQLARYWGDACQKYPKHKKHLVYLTHHRFIPKNDLEKSERLTPTEHLEPPSFFWLGWFALFSCIDGWLKNTTLHYSEKKILESLRRYLIHQKYTCFLGWNGFPKTAVTFPRYVRTAKTGR